jgi:hypothetical protein
LPMFLWLYNHRNIMVIIIYTVNFKVIEKFNSYTLVHIKFSVEKKLFILMNYLLKMSLTYTKTYETKKSTRLAPCALISNLIMHASLMFTD